MLNKKVKEYTGRQRIDINKNDGLTPGAEVVILTLDEYNAIKDDILDIGNKLAAKDSELQLMKNQEQNLKEIIKNVTAPIHERHDKEIAKKDAEIERLSNELKALHDKTTQYNLDMQGLNIFDIAIFHKHKKLIAGFNEDIALIGVDQEIINTGAKAIPDNDPDE